LKKQRTKTHHYEAIARGLDIVGMMGPTYLETKHVHQKLVDKGYEVSRKTVERDLQKLPELFPQHVFVNDRSKPYGYKSPQGARKISGMSPDQAVCLQLAFEYLYPLLPNRSLEPITPYLKEAEAILEMNATKRMKNWKNKVLTLNEGFNLLPAKIKDGILPSIQSSLWEGKQVRAKYRSAYSKKLKTYLLHPVGLVYRGRVSYLICSFDNHLENYSYLPLHRFHGVEIINELSEHKDKNVKSVATIVGFLVSSEKIKVKLKFSKTVGGHTAGGHLRETPISNSQKITETDDGFIIVEDTIDDVMEFKWWVRAFGDSVEVLKPKSLREEFTQMSKRMRNMYE
jgi:predicted DNA-binding transcriptional regulator YafY